MLPIRLSPTIRRVWTRLSGLTAKKGARVIYKSCYDEKTEADYVLEQISNIIARDGYEYKDFCDFSARKRADEVF